MNVWTKILQSYELSDIDLDCKHNNSKVAEDEGGRGGCSPPQTKFGGAEPPRFGGEKHFLYSFCKVKPPSHA